MSLPESWKRIPVKDVATLVSGGTPTRTNPRFFGGGIPWATPADATAATGLYLKKTAETVTEAGIRASSIVRLPAGSVLMTARATVGAVVIASEETTTSQDFVNFLPNPELINNKYLAHLLRFSKSEILRFSTGTTFAAVSQSAMAKWNVLLPPLLEQERIVSILEKVESTRKNYREIQMKAREISNSLFRESFLQHPDHKNWRVITVGEAGEVQLGRQRSPQYQTGRYSKPYLRVANVLENALDLSEATGVLEMDFDSADLARYRLKLGDVLLVEGHGGDGLGRPAMWRDEGVEMCYQNHLIRFRSSTEVLPEYALAVFLNMYNSGIFTRISPSADLPSLGTARFSRLPFVIPPIELQQKFVQKVLKVRVLLEKVAEKMMSFENLSVSIVASTFSGVLTRTWRENPEIAAILEEQARASDTLLVGQEPDSSPESSNESSVNPRPLLELFNWQERFSVAMQCFDQLQIQQPLRFPTAKGNTAQWLDVLLKVAELASESQTGQTESETLEKLRTALQNAEDPTLQGVASDISNMGLEARVAFNPDDPKHTRSHFWQEVQQDSPLRSVYNAMRITPGYSNLRTIMQTLADLNEPLEEHHVAQAIQTLETAGLIDAVTLEMPRSRSSIETVLLHAYRLPQPETQSNPFAEIP